ncbi:RimJ/RimL family protein N-acetyltransferase [Actinoplanes tereljensis]|uniref:N-acetyltransferase n=1 Tax=Paractinoplanes tereljensis TaxID=571912 RepID=A0A919TSW9_9ACTN|nr:GNAT family N-acetyltransferase [Actinoplanes tereljensis]GIF19492.1 N-acetyltransferase [Actinoplanes tereljensis]
MPVIALRPVADADVEPLFQMMRDPEAVRMAAFTSEDPDDREAFEAHLSRIRANPEVTNRVITEDGEIVGNIACFVMEGDTEITYWIDRSRWGQGIATEALTQFLDLVKTRPLHARAASDNARSLQVLQKAGFAPIRTEVSYAAGRSKDIEETVLLLP